MHNNIKELINTLNPKKRLKKSGENYESQIAPKAGTPLLINPYTTFCVNF